LDNVISGDGKINIATRGKVVDVTVTVVGVNVVTAILRM